MESRRASPKYIATMSDRTDSLSLSGTADHKLKSHGSLRRVSVNDKRLLIVSKHNNFQSMSNLVEAAKVGNVAKVLELLPTSDINGTDEVR